MKRWTNGLPGATKRLGAMMAQRGLSASQPRMRADTHDGPEQMLHLRGLIHCCSSHVRRSWIFCLATHGPGHTSWHLASFRCDAEFGPLSAHIGHRVAIKLDLWVRALVSRTSELRIGVDSGPSGMWLH